MSDVAIAKLIIAVTLMSTIFSVTIYQAMRDKPMKVFEKKFAEALAHWIQAQVCLQCNVSIEELDKRAKQRISGAAVKAIRPLRENSKIELQLPNIVQNRLGQWQHFKLEVSIEHVRHLVPESDRSTS